MQRENDLYIFANILFWSILDNKKGLENDSAVIVTFCVLVI